MVGIFCLVLGNRHLPGGRGIYGAKAPPCCPQPFGVFISHVFMDDNIIKIQMKAFYGKGNTLIRKFKQSSVEVKTMLFESFSMNMYHAEMWNNYTGSSFKQLKLSYNKSFLCNRTLKYYLVIPKQQC